MYIILSFNNPVLIIQATKDVIYSLTSSVTRISLCSSPSPDPVLLKYII